MFEYWKLKNWNVWILKTKMFEYGKLKCLNIENWNVWILKIKMFEYWKLKCLNIEMFKYWKLKFEMFEFWKLKTEMSDPNMLCIWVENTIIQFAHKNMPTRLLFALNPSKPK
jgi:hypothetical protein